MYARFYQQTVPHSPGCTTHAGCGKGEKHLLQPALARLRLHHDRLCFLLHHPAELLGHQEAAPGFGRRRSHASRHHRLDLLRDIRPRQVHEQLPRRPHEQQALLRLRSLHVVRDDGGDGSRELLHTARRALGHQWLVPVLRCRPVHRFPEPMVQQSYARHALRRLVHEPQPRLVVRLLRDRGHRQRLQLVHGLHRSRPHLARRHGLHLPRHERPPGNARSAERRRPLRGEDAGAGR